MELRFLCDHMLHRLGRWLRAAGYDTLIAEGTLTDLAIFEWGVEDERWVLTRDRHFLEFPKHAETVVHFTSNSVDGCARELTQQLPIDWEFDPFTRCLICNSPFQSAPKLAIEEVPENVIESQTSLYFCPSCEKIYWWGSHTKVMRAQLHKWNRHKK